jgi:drug/metabolite transporter (DMT)-like permease
MTYTLLLKNNVFVTSSIPSIVVYVCIQVALAALMLQLQRHCVAQYYSYPGVSAFHVDSTIITNRFPKSRLYTPSKSNRHPIDPRHPISTSLYFHIRPQQEHSQRNVHSYSQRHHPMYDSSIQNSNNIHDMESLDAGPWESTTARTLGLAVLLTVPLAWGTYTPVVKFLYEVVDPPVPGLVFSAAYYGVAALSLQTIVAFQRSTTVTPHHRPILSDTTAATTTTSLTTSTQSTTHISTHSPAALWGGIELGTYLFIGNILQVLGLKTVPADRAGFLVQLTTVMVPLLQASLSGRLQAVSTRTWLSCLVAFGGVVVMNLDGKVDFTNPLTQTHALPDLLQDLASSLSQGDLLIVLAAFVYSFHVVRLGNYAPQTTAAQLAASKATVEAILSVSLVGLLLYLGGSSSNMPMPDAHGLWGYVQTMGIELSSYVTNVQNMLAQHDTSTSMSWTAWLPAIGATLWTGWVTCAYTIFAQSYGQSRVNPTDANLIYTIQPLFTALFAFALLGETIGPLGVLGGVLIGAAVYNVAAEEGNNLRIKDDDDGSGDDDELTGTNGDDTNDSAHMRDAVQELEVVPHDVCDTTAATKPMA